MRLLVDGSELLIWCLPALCGRVRCVLGDRWGIDGSVLGSILLAWCWMSKRDVTRLYIVENDGKHYEKN